MVLFHYTVLGEIPAVPNPEDLEIDLPSLLTFRDELKEYSYYLERKEQELDDERTQVDLDANHVRKKWAALEYELDIVKRNWDRAVEQRRINHQREQILTKRVVQLKQREADVVKYEQKLNYMIHNCSFKILPVEYIQTRARLIWQKLRKGIRQRPCPNCYAVTMFYLMALFWAFLLTGYTVMADDSSPSSGYALSGFDCTNPVKYQAQQLPTYNDCHFTKSPPATTHYYTLLQELTSTELVGYRCSISRSTFAYHCGYASHLSLIRAPLIDIPYPVSIGDCKNMAFSNTIELHNTDLKIYPDEVRVYHLTEEGSLVNDAGSISCVGTDTSYDNQVSYGELRLSQYKITLKRIRMRSNLNQIMSIDDHLTLRCSAQAEACTGTAVTYIWNHHEENICKMRHVRQLAGHLIPGIEKNVFVDKSKNLRLEISNEVHQKCDGLRVYPTNFKNFYVTQQTDLGMISQIKASKIDLAAWVTSRDDFILYYLEQLFEGEEGASYLDTCRNLVTDNLNQPSGLIPLGGPLFHLIKGEIDHHLVCKQVEVLADDTSLSCFLDIPVLYDSNPFFLEPRSRLL